MPRGKNRVDGNLPSTEMFCHLIVFDAYGKLLIHRYVQESESQLSLWKWSIVFETSAEKKQINKNQKNACKKFGLSHLPAIKFDRQVIENRLINNYYIARYQIRANDLTHIVNPECETKFVDYQEFLKMTRANEVVPCDKMFLKHLFELANSL